MRRKSRYSGRNIRKYEEIVGKVNNKYIDGWRSTLFIWGDYGNMNDEDVDIF